MKLIFFGAGFCSKFILESLEGFDEIICTHNLELTSQPFDDKLKIKRMTFSEFSKDHNSLFTGVTHLLNSIPPIKGRDIVFDLFKKTENANFKELEWLGYLSSTSVYGDHLGKWVDEYTKVNPKTIRGIIRKNVEDSYFKLFKERNIPIHIFRLPGIYGPGRSIIEKLINGKNLVIKKPNQFFSRIYVEDISSAIIKSMKNPTPGEIFNITDNNPCSSEEVTIYAAKLLKIKNLTFIDINSPKINKITKDFYSDNKRVSNKKIKKILGWTPKFENYKLGLEEILNIINGKNTANNPLS